MSIALFVAMVGVALVAIGPAQVFVQMYWQRYRWRSQRITYKGHILSIASAYPGTAVAGVGAGLMVIALFVAKGDASTIGILAATMGAILIGVGILQVFVQMRSPDTARQQGTRLTISIKLLDFTSAYAGTTLIGIGALLLVAALIADR